MQPEAERMLTALTDEECRRLLAANHLGRLAVTLPSGRPLIRPVNYVFDQPTQSVVFRSRAGSKHYALTHAPRACFEIDDGAGGATGAWSVIIIGTPRSSRNRTRSNASNDSDWIPGAAGRICAGFASTPTRSPDDDWPEPPWDFVEDRTPAPRLHRVSLGWSANAAVT